MSLQDKLCAAGFVLALVLIGARLFYLNYRRANPKPRHPLLTSVKDGRRG
jgi:hypothetical protein